MPGVFDPGGVKSLDPSAVLLNQQSYLLFFKYSPGSGGRAPRGELLVRVGRRHTDFHSPFGPGDALTHVARGGSRFVFDVYQNPVADCLGANLVKVVDALALVFHPAAIVLELLPGVLLGFVRLCDPIVRGDPVGRRNSSGATGHRKDPGAWARRRPTRMCHTIFALGNCYVCCVCGCILGRSADFGCSARQFGGKVAGEFIVRAFQMA